MDTFTSAARSMLGLDFSKEQLSLFEHYALELTAWNQKINLTAIIDPIDILIKHFLDSLTVTLAWPESIGSAVSRLIDVGTGVGIPGIPLKILFPDITLVLLDSTAKKAAFLHYFKDKLGLDDVEIVVGRAEEVAHDTRYREKFDMVLSRSVASLPALVELALPFGAVGGCFIAQKKGDIDSEISQAARTINLLGGNLREVKKVDLAEFTDGRRLVIIDKLTLTPSQYPRRPGMPTKRPIMKG